MTWRFDPGVAPRGTERDMDELRAGQLLRGLPSNPGSSLPDCDSFTALDSCDFVRRVPTSTGILRLSLAGGCRYQGAIPGGTWAGAALTRPVAPLVGFFSSPWG